MYQQNFIVGSFALKKHQGFCAFPVTVDKEKPYWDLKDIYQRSKGYLRYSILLAKIIRYQTTLMFRSLK